MALRSPSELESTLLSIVTKNGIESSVSTLPTKLTVFPSSLQQIEELVKRAIKDKITLLPMGSGSHLYLNGRKLDVAISLSRMDTSIIHSPNDLTATVPAGKSYHEVQQLLFKHRQMIPIHPEATDSSTIGGIISANGNGASRIRYGTARDWVIGTGLINGEGIQVKSGGKVVKNVSGYDMHKIYIGARGSLGILTKISFKLFPVPEKIFSLNCTLDNFDLAIESAYQFYRLSLNLETLTLSNTSAGQWTVALTMADEQKSLQQQGELVLKQIEKNSEIISSKHKISSYAIPQNDTAPIKNVYTIKISLRRSYLNKHFKDIIKNIHVNTELKILPTGGQIFLTIPYEEDKSELVVRTLVETVKKLKGNMEFLQLPEGSKLDRWPILPSTIEWMHRIKTSLDPHHIFAPGTFVGNL